MKILRGVDKYREHGKEEAKILKKLGGRQVGLL